MLQIKKIPEDCVMSLIISSNCKFTNLAACVMCHVSTSLASKQRGEAPREDRRQSRVGPGASCQISKLVCHSLFAVQIQFVFTNVCQCRHRRSSCRFKLKHQDFIVDNILYSAAEVGPGPGLR